MPRASGAGVGASPRNFRLRNWRLFCLSIYTFFVFFPPATFSCLRWVSGRSPWLVSWFPASHPATQEMGRKESVRIHRLKLLWQQVRGANTFLFYLFIYCCWSFLMRHTRDRLSRSRLGILACWSDFVLKISNKWVFSFHLVPFKSSLGSTPCFQRHL